MTNERKALNDLSNMVNEYYRRTREHGKAVNTIKQALERLEQLEKENQELKAKGKELVKDVRKAIDVAKKLKEEDQDKNKAFNILNKLCTDQTNLIGKYEKVIEILKEETELRIAVVQGQYLIQQGAGNVYVSKEKGELLSEVLGE